ncbi:iron complex outermembrane recepter protein [Sphingobium sp. AP50]|uniref:TonB-dependent receptor n=1 Tax=Sphingobium sp. AP50 TaxID=1884369 RepID=UPI0008B46B19|nr:TonB-dependent receptor [Sphingobium sp. AP50]SEJ96674.1 iron complex outermembrane recepter protein [Sphingobium sp. AP50]
MRKSYRFGLLASCILPFAAHAQEAPQPQDSGIGSDIVVTAERREGSLQTTPISVSALGETALQQLQINRTADLMRVVPSLVVASGTVDPTTLTIFMRGAGQNGGTWLGFESAVGLYVDDTYFSRLTGANLDLADLERVEVLRGPQGTLYGRNTLVGAIKYVTKKPSDTAFGDFLGEYGSDNLVRLKGTVSQPLSDNWAALVTGNYFHRDGFFNAEALGDKKYGDRDEYGGRAAIKYIGDGPFGVYLTGFFSHSENAGTIGVAVNPTTLQNAREDIYTYLSPTRGFGKNFTYGGDLTLSWQGENVELKSITAYLRGHQEFVNDLTGGRPGNSAENGYLIGFNELTSDSKYRTFSQEFQAIGDAMDGKLSYIGGLYYFRESGWQMRQDYVLYTYDTLPQMVYPTTKSYAAYGQLTYKITDAIDLVGGLRYTKEDKNVSGVTQASLTDIRLVPVGGKLKAKAWTPKAGINVRASDDVFLYASASRGFQGGGFNYLALAAPLAFNTSFDPETVWAYEVGAKLSFWDKKGHLNLAAYRNDFSDILTSMTVPTGSSLTQNAGEARVEGIEWEANIRPIPELTLFASGAYSHGKYTAINPNSDPAKAGAKYIPNVAKWQYDIGFNGNIPSGAMGTFLIGGDVSYISPRYLGGTNAPMTLLDKRHVVNAFVGWQPEGSRLEVKLSAENLLKEEYYVYGNVIGGAYAMRSPGDPQTFRLSVKYSY